MPALTAERGWVGAKLGDFGGRKCSCVKDDIHCKTENQL